MKTLNAILSGILGISEAEINDDTSPDAVEGWDSFNGLMIVSELESNFNIKFTTNEVVSVRRVSDIKQALKRHGVPTEYYS